MVYVRYGHLENKSDQRTILFPEKNNSLADVLDIQNISMLGHSGWIPECIGEWAHAGAFNPAEEVREGGQGKLPREGAPRLSYKEQIEVTVRKTMDEERENNGQQDVLWELEMMLEQWVQGVERRTMGDELTESGRARLRSAWMHP